MISKGSSINDVTVLWRGGQGFCDDSNKKHDDMWRGSKIVSIYVMSFMDDPQSENSIKYIHFF